MTTPFRLREQLRVLCGQLSDAIVSYELANTEDTRLATISTVQARWEQMTDLLDEGMPALEREHEQVAREWREWRRRVEGSVHQLGRAA